MKHMTNEMLPSESSFLSETRNKRTRLDTNLVISAERLMLTDVHPVYTSQKIKGEIKPKENKPLIVNQQNHVYYFKCDLCYADYVGFTSRRLLQRVEIHKRSTMRNQVKDEHVRSYLFNYFTFNCFWRSFFYHSRYYLCFVSM